MSNYQRNDLPNLLVTGGAGFIGSNFVLHARKLGYGNVISLDKLTYASNLQNLVEIERNEKYQEGYRFIQGDIGNSELVTYLLEEYEVDAVINFAAETHVDRSIFSPGNFIETNVVGTFKLLEASKTYWQKLSSKRQESFRFLHISTDEVYGSLNAEDPAFREDSQYAPNSPYAASKASADHLVRSYHHTYGLPTLTTNCSNNYGPLQFPEKLIPLMIINAINGKSLPIYGDGQNIRDWLYVTDHCDAIYLVLQKGRIGENYNIGGMNEKTNLVVVNKICEILERLAPKPNYEYSSLITFIKDRPGHDRRYAIDCSKIAKELGWQPKENFESGLIKTVRWYLDNAAWVEYILTGAYQNWIKQNYESRETSRLKE
jgi:dTDP-glucose 4,6-dehydratase